MPFFSSQSFWDNGFSWDPGDCGLACPGPIGIAAEIGLVARGAVVLGWSGCSGLSLVHTVSRGGISARLLCRGARGCGAGLRYWCVEAIDPSQVS